MMNRCVSWLLLLTHAVLLGSSGLGIWLAVDNFGVEDEDPPTPPTTTTTTTTTPSYRSDYDSYGGRTKEFREYVDKTEKYARLNEDARLFVVVPCGVMAATSVVLLLAGLCSRKLFTTTASLFTSLGVWILTLVTILTYQNTFAYNDGDFFPGAIWVVAIQVGLILLLSLQILLAMWELRRQKSGWPNINISHLFTLDAIFLVARLTLAVFVVILYCDSRIFWGLRGDCEYGQWQCPAVRYPLWIGISGAVAAAYSVVVSGEAVLSYFLGSLHPHLAWVTSLMSAVCTGWVAVMTSPVFIKSYIGPYWTYSELMYLAIITSIVTFVHTIACLVIPTILRTTPKFIKLIGEKLSTLSLREELGAAGTSLTTISDMQKKATQVNQKFKVTPQFLNNVISSVVSVVLIIILSTSWDGHMYYEWGAILLLAVNLIVLCRTIPLMVVQYWSHIVEPLSQRVVRQVVEGIIVLVACCGSFGHQDGIIAVAVLQVLVTIIQVLLLMREYIELKKQMSGGGDGDQLLEEESQGEEENQGQEDITTPHTDPLSLA